MKTAVIVASMFAVLTVVNGLDIERLRHFRQDSAKCNKELGGSRNERRVEKIKCTLEKHQLMKANGEIDSDKVLEAIRDGISDPSKLEQAVALHINCHHEVTARNLSTAQEKTAEIIKCAMGILDLLDKIN